MSENSSTPAESDLAESSPLENPSVFMDMVVDAVRKYGAKTDFYLFRQLNQLCYEALNDTYLDYVGNSISFGKNFWDADRGVWNCKMKTYTDKTVVLKPITIGNWTPKIANIFRTIEIYDEKPDNLNLNRMFTQLCPYITTINMDYRYQHTLFRSKALLETFFNQFKSLKKLHLGGYGANFFIDPFKTVLGNMESKPDVTIDLSCNFETTLVKLGTEPNTRFILNLIDGNEAVVRFQSISNEFGNLTNIMYNLHLTGNVNDVAQLNQLAALCYNHVNQIRILTLSFEIQNNTPWLQDGNEDAFRSSLAQLSPLVTGLELHQMVTKRWKLLSEDSYWPRLHVLKIRGYVDPLEILKNSPALHSLTLEARQETCFFANTERTVMENLEYYFGNLSELQNLTIYGVQEKDMLFEDTELDEYLKALLPSLEKVTYIEW